VQFIGVTRGSAIVDLLIRNSPEGGNVNVNGTLDCF